MSLEEQAIPAETVVEDQNLVETPSPEVTQTTEIKADGQSPVPEQLTEPVVEFKPNYKFKAGQEEKEIPEFLRSVIKDEKTQKDLIEMLEKSEGLPAMKERLTKERNDFESKYSEAEKAHTTLSGAVNKLQKFYESGDIDGFLDFAKMSPEKILQWAYDKVSYSQLPLEQRQAYDQKVQAQRRAMDLEEQNQVYSQQMQSQTVQHRTMMLDFELSKPDVSEMANKFDALAGKPGAFRQEVINHGQLVYAQQNIDLSPDQAAKAVADRYKNFLNAQPTNTVAAPINQATQAKVVQKTNTGAIPNVQNSGGSPVKSTINSLADLKKLRNEMRSRS